VKLNTERRRSREDRDMVCKIINKRRLRRDEIETKSGLSVCTRRKV
jgi:hypothetical protein